MPTEIASTSAIARLQHLVKQHLGQRGLSARAFAERTGLGYPGVLALINKGGVPRSAQHRESLRRELGLDQNHWASVVAASQRDTLHIPADGPLTLRQLTVKSLLAQGFTEQSFANVSGIPYPTLMGITRRDAVPRSDTLVVLAEKLGIGIDDVRQAVALTRTPRQHHDSDKESTVTATAIDESTPSLAQVVADTIVRGGGSVAAFARAYDIPYVSLMKLINTGQPPRRKSVLDPLAKALNIPQEAFAASLAKSKLHPMPAEAPRQSDNAANPFHAALLRLVEEKNFTTKAFAEAADLSVLTAAKLLKRGELPGRATTHEKLRSLLGLTEIAYRDLLASSRSVEDEAGIHTSATAAGYVAVSTGAAPSATTKGELFELIDRLSPAQLVALKNFLLSVL